MARCFRWSSGGVQTPGRQSQPEAHCCAQRRRALGGRLPCGRCACKRKSVRQGRGRSQGAAGRPSALHRAPGPACNWLRSLRSLCSNTTASNRLAMRTGARGPQALRPNQGARACARHQQSSAMFASGRNSSAPQMGAAAHPEPPLQHCHWHAHSTPRPPRPATTRIRGQAQPATLQRVTELIQPQFNGASPPEDHEAPAGKHSCWPSQTRHSSQ